MLISSSSLTFAGQEDARIDKVRLDFNAAYNKSDAEAMGRLIDKDGVFMPPGEPNVIGRDNIVARYANFFTKILSKFELKPGEIQKYDNFAFMSGDYERSDRPKAGGTVKGVAGHYLLVLKKQTDGTWKIVSDIWNHSAKP